MTEETAYLKLFPLSLVLFPGINVPLHIFEERYKLMVNECLENDEPFGIVLMRDDVRPAVSPCLRVSVERRHPADVVEVPVGVHHPPHRLGAPLAQRPGNRQAVRHPARIHHDQPVTSLDGDRLPEPARQRHARHHLEQLARPCHLPIGLRPPASPCQFGQLLQRRHLALQPQRMRRPLRDAPS